MAVNSWRRIGTPKLRLALTSNQARVGQGMGALNDKFQCLFISRAKECLVAGSELAGRSSEVTGKMNLSKNIQEDASNTFNTTMSEPGSSRDTFKDIPGKAYMKLCVKTLLPGPTAARGAGQVREAAQGGGQGGAMKFQMKKFVFKVLANNREKRCVTWLM